MTVLILGGTAEARTLAGELLATGNEVVSSLAGAVQRPALPPGEVRIGGFGGPTGLADFLRQRRITCLVDATHPFAARISAHAATAAQLSGVAILRLERPGWSGHPDADRWTWVDDTAGALAAGRSSRRPFLTTGRQSLAEFLPWSDRRVLARVVDPPTILLPDSWVVLRSRGPYDLPGERATLRSHGADLLVTKDSGGSHTAPKLSAAADLQIPVVVIRRPRPIPGIPRLATVAETVAAVLAAGGPP